MNELQTHASTNLLNTEDILESISTGIVFEGDIKSDEENNVEYDDEFIAGI